MGCLQSKKETSDLHPNVFRVVNIDENGAELCSGQLGITESDIILYREGRDSTVWPLHSLRRYGFEGEIFSFESGRRCDTGEGIYAFRCRRASLLFRSLQQQIQLRNVIHDSSTYPVSRLSPSPQGRQTLQASVVHRSSIDNGHQANVNTNLNNNIPSLIAQAPVRDINQSPRSPSSADILEVMPLYPRNQENSNHVTNVYQLREFKREHNNNQSESTSERHHVYSNDLTRDLAVLRNALRQEAALNTMRDIEDETRFLESRFINNVANQINNPLSPTLSNTSEHYAQLSIEQQDSGRMYMNIAPSSNSNTEICRNLTLTTPQTPKLVEYCNLGVGVKQEVITYANLSIGEIPDGKGYDQKYSEFEAFNSMSPVEELEVNYVILDLEPNADETKKSPDHSYPENQFQSGSKEAGTGSTAQSQRGCLVTQGSVDKTAGLTVSEVPASIGYTTIDFDKTVALTSVASGGEMDQEGPRKTRHNTNNAMCGSPNSILKSN